MSLQIWVLIIVGTWQVISLQIRIPITVGAWLAVLTRSPERLIILKFKANTIGDSDNFVLLYSMNELGM